MQKAHGISYALSQAQIGGEETMRNLAILHPKGIDRRYLGGTNPLNACKRELALAEYPPYLGWMTQTRDWWIDSI